jgi:hypothetical protein
VRRRLVPKVLIASQTRVIEAVADPSGEWVPGVPVVSAAPNDATPDAVWALAAVLTNPVTSALLAASAAGSGLSSGTLRVGAPTIAALPWPVDDEAVCEAAIRLRRGDIEGCGVAAMRAYRLDPEDAGSVLEWWLAALRRIRL